MFNTLIRVNPYSCTVGLGEDYILFAMIKRPIRLLTHMQPHIQSQGEEYVFTLTSA